MAADPIHHAGDDWFNLYLVEDGERVVLVDAGLPGLRGKLRAALARIGRTEADISDVVLTHPHADHAGLAETLRKEHGATVHVPELDEKLARTGLAPLGERGPIPYMRHRTFWEVAARLVKNGGAIPRPIRAFETYGDGAELPGGLLAVHTPGHTQGHTALLHRASGTLFSGDALCTRNPATGRRGPQLMPGSYTQDVDRAEASLGALAATGAERILPGHGEPWTQGAAAAVEAARRAGRS
jgi:glyoxylase-like metal-dependent hydrolase (beta-lactamase superfamily II)